MKYEISFFVHHNWNFLIKLLIHIHQVSNTPLFANMWKQIQRGHWSCKQIVQRGLNNMMPWWLDCKILDWVPLSTNIILIFNVYVTKQKQIFIFNKIKESILIHEYLGFELKICKKGNLNICQILSNIQRMIK